MAKEREKVEPLTLSVAEAGALDNLGYAASYRAVAKGDMPTISINGRLRVPKKKWLAKLNGEAA